MTDGMKTMIYPVKDLAAAKAVYGALLGAAPDVDQPYYVGFTAGDQHLGLAPNGHARGMTGPLPYWHVPDIRQSLDALIAAGAQLEQDVTDVGGGKLVATVKDADGNLTGVLQQPAGG